MLKFGFFGKLLELVTGRKSTHLLPGVCSGVSPSSIRQKTTHQELHSLESKGWKGVREAWLMGGR